MADTLSAVLAKENRNIDADDIARRTIAGTLQSSEISVVVNALQSAKQKVIQQMKKDWKTYNDAQTSNPNIQKHNDYFVSILTESKEFSYKTYPETHNVLLCIRDDFADKNTGSKTAFLKMMGFMLDCGHKQMSSASAFSAKILNNKNYDNFISIIKQQYPNDAENTINTMLGINSADNLEQARRAAFDKKSKELYGKFLSAVLVKKKQQNDSDHVINFDYQSYINKGVAGYIAEMKEGKNNIAQNLHLVDESKASSIKQLIDDTAENQIISVHHKIPVASAVPLYLMQHPDLHSADMAQKLYDELHKVCPQATNGRDAKDIATIGFALTVFPKEALKDNPAAIQRIPDPKRRKQALQVYENKKAIRQLYQKYFPLKADTKSIQEEILRIVNNPSNHTLPIGNNVHQKMEPNGHGYIVKQDNTLYINVENTSKIDKTTTDKINNATILAAEYDIADLREVTKGLNKNFKEGIEQVNPLLKINSNQNKQSPHQTVSSRFLLNLPETGFMHKIRNTLNSLVRFAPLEYINKSIGLTK